MSRIKTAVCFLIVCLCLSACGSTTPLNLKGITGESIQAVLNSEGSTKPAEVLPATKSGYNGIRANEITGFYTTREDNYTESSEYSSSIVTGYFDSGALEKRVYADCKGNEPLRSTIIEYSEPDWDDLTASGNEYEYEANQMKLTGHRKVKYDDFMRVVEETRFDEFNQFIQVSSYSFDDDENLTGTQVKDAEGKYVNEQYEYDEYNVLLKTTVQTVSGNETSETVKTYEYDFDQDGLPSVRYEYQDGELINTISITRGVGSLITEETITTKTGETHTRKYGRYLPAVSNKVLSSLCGDWADTDGDRAMQTYIDGRNIYTLIACTTNRDDVYKFWEIEGRPEYDEYQKCWKITYEDGISYYANEEKETSDEKSGYSGSLKFFDEGYCIWYSSTDGTEMTFYLQ